MSRQELKVLNILNMCAGDVIEDDLVQRYQFVLNRASCNVDGNQGCLLYTSPSPRDGLLSRMPSSA